MKEWSTRNTYNSFNSFKGLTYYENYKAILAWMDGKGELPPPIECNLDPIAECNLNCSFCIVQRYLKHRRYEIGQMTKLPTEYLYRLVDFLSEWGVKGLCISGGGEPTLHRGMWYLPEYATRKGIKTSVFTNGTKLNSTELAEGLLACQWVAVSIDAANALTYHNIKGKDLFGTVIRGVTKLANLRYMTGSSTNICYKFLIIPDNAGEIYDACLLAKRLGAQDFHARPADIERVDMEYLGDSYDMALIAEQFEACHMEETDTFHVHTVSHKFDPNFHVVHNFTRCLATPIMLPILTDGNAYLCPDRKMEAPFRLGSCYPNPEWSILDWWGSDAHRELIKGVNVCTCSRCTWCAYNEQMERAVLNDGMCLSFP